MMEKERLVNLAAAEALAKEALKKDGDKQLAAVLILMCEEKRLLFKILLAIDACKEGIAEMEWNRWGVSLEDTERICAELTAYRKEICTWICLPSREEG